MTKSIDPNNEVSSDSKVGEQEDSKEEKQYYMDDISSQWRKFNVDLMPKVCISFKTNHHKFNIDNYIQKKTIRDCFTI